MGVRLRPFEAGVGAGKQLVRRVSAMLRAPLKESIKWPIKPGRHDRYRGAQGTAGPAAQDLPLKTLSRMTSLVFHRRAIVMASGSNTSGTSNHRLAWSRTSLV